MHFRFTAFGERYSRCTSGLDRLDLVSPIYPHHYNVAARLIKNNYFIKYNKNYLKIHILKKRIADFDLLL